MTTLFKQFTQIIDSEIELSFKPNLLLVNHHGYVIIAVTSSKIKIRAVNKFVWLKTCKPVQIHRDAREMYGKKIISRGAVEK